MTDVLATGAPFRGVVGTAILRKEDPRLLTGEARFTDDRDIPGALSVSLVRSPYAHARIVRVDTSAAAAMPGVVAAYDGKDLAQEWAGRVSWPTTP